MALLPDLKDPEVIHSFGFLVDWERIAGSNYRMPPLTRAIAAAQGIARGQLESKRYRRLLRGVYLPADEPLTLRAWVAAARLVMPDDAVPSGLTALQLAGLDLGQPLPLQFMTTSTAHTVRPELQLHILEQVSDGPALVGALVEHCRAVPLLDAVAVADRALHLGIVGAEEVAALAGHSNRVVPMVGRLARPGAESVRETRLRLCCVLARLPEPRLQVELRDDDGFVGRFEMGYDEFCVLVEYDGEQHLTDRAQWTRDILKEERARALGHSLVRVNADLFRDPWAQVMRVHDALVPGGYRGRPPVRTAAWDAAFGPLRQRTLAA